MIKQTDLTLEAWLVRATAATGPYDPAALYLGVMGGVADKGGLTAMADIIPATGAMATRKAVTPWGTPYKMNDGRWVVDGPLLTFTPLDASEAQSVVGFYLASALTAGVLKAWALFPESISAGDETHRVSIIPRLTIDPLGRFSAEVVFNG